MKNMVYLVSVLWFLAGLLPGCAREEVKEPFRLMMEEGRWFELEQAFAQREDMDPLTHDLSEALLLHYFNKPERAVYAINKVLHNHRSALDTVMQIKLIRLLAEDEARCGKYAEARQTVWDGLDNWFGAMEPKERHQFTLLLEQYKAMEQVPVMRVERAEKEVVLPLHIERGENTTALKTEGLFMGKNVQFTIDTGAGVNIISADMAAVYGMKPVLDSIPIVGTGLEYGSIVIADSLSLGEITLFNVPFVAYDFNTPDLETTRLLEENYRYILGVPVLNALREVQLDFAAATFTVPAVLTSGTLPFSNLHLTDRGILKVVIESKEKPLYLRFDSGAGSGSYLSWRYYNEHRNDIQLRGTREDIYIGGVGGVRRIHAYKLYSFPVKLGNTHAFVPEIDIFPDERSVLMEEGDGSFGVDMFLAFSRLTINLQDMFVEAEPHQPE